MHDAPQLTTYHLELSVHMTHSAKEVELQQKQRVSRKTKGQTSPATDMPQTWVDLPFSGYDPWGGDSLEKGGIEKQ